MPGDEALDQRLAEALPGVRRFAVALTRDPVRAEDLVQEALLRLLERGDDVDQLRDLGSWLRRVVHNLAVDAARRTREISVESVEERWMSDAYTVDAEAVVEQAEMRAAVEDALVRLPFIYRAAVVLHDVEGMTMAEVADVTGVALPAAKQRLRRGRMMLVTALAEGRERRAALTGVPMSCWDARSRVSDYLDGDVDGAAAERLRSHLAACPTCPPLLASLVGVRARLGRLRDSDTTLPPATAARVRQQIASHDHR